ncbi:ABC-2 type transport system permease protein [Nakamurella panacisegetis]|uniref:ABC-2 type transport system permease protein n=1 Tax=Nakamurella panacisegetis TaxID=1090615 RepID=A0A1H0PH12_9ACTN|nr:ABC-2 family transporter protein [Nakamurella panacisegetis]SDP03958.1 ABC-2 type transport system permease protein [Nakamurella panacisegetis]
MTAPVAVGRVRSLTGFYVATMKIALATQFQYRTGNYLYMIGMITEPVIYLVVWTTVARQSGGTVAGLTVGNLAAYYIVWTLVRNMNLVFTPYGFEERIRSGQMSGLLLQPIHPVHGDIAYFAGWKFAVIVFWLPIAAVLSLIFHPALHTSAAQVGVFLIAIWAAFLIRALFLWVLGLISFWTTRVSAIYQLYFAIELLMSGRLVPLQIMPGWVQHLTRFLPFASTFGYPIQSLTGPISPAALWGGLLEQFVWVGVGAALVALVWKRAVRRYTAVGN